MDRMTNFNIERVNPEQDLCSCGVCFARNTGDEPAEIYNVKFGGVVVRLCRTCATRLRDAIDASIQDSCRIHDPYKKILIHVLPEDMLAAPETELYFQQVQRLKNLIDHLPAWSMYSCVMEWYGGVHVDPRSQDSYTDAEPDSCQDLTKDLLESHADAALRRLDEHSRLEYIATGTTDLGQYFGPVGVNWCRQNGFYVLADLDAWDDALHLGRPGLTSTIVQQAAKARKAYGFLT